MNITAQAVYFEFNSSYLLWTTISMFRPMPAWRHHLFVWKAVKMQSKLERKLWVLLVNRSLLTSQKPPLLQITVLEFLDGQLGTAAAQATLSKRPGRRRSCC